jgi:3-oxoadipate enol-lactonase
MHVEIEGPQDAPDVVLLHGGTGTGAFHWGKQARTLRERWRVHLPDLPGHGNTPLPPSGEYSRKVLVEAVAEYAESLGPPVHVGGFSMGGHAALALAADQPDLFASLVLVGVSIREHPGLDGWRKGFDPDRLKENYPLWARQLSRLHEPLGGADAWREVSRRDASGLDIDADLDRLAALDCPVLLVRGDRDPAVDPAHYAELRAIWPHAEELVVPAGHHDVQLTRRRIVEAALADFLQRAAD